MTSRHRGPKRKRSWCPLASYYNTVTLQCYLWASLFCCEHCFSLSSVVSCNFSVRCTYLTFRHHPHPLGYLCTKFHFFRSLHCEASPWRKIVYSITHSLTHSINHPVYLMLWQPYQCIIYDKNGQCQHRQICVFSRLFNISFSISHRYIIKFDEAI